MTDNKEEITPAKKARELVSKMNGINVLYPRAIQNALIVCDEVIKACEYNHVEHWNTNWWNKVKEEINKLR